MEIEFSTNKLEKQYEKKEEAIKAFGADVGKKYIQRVNIIKASKSFDDLYKIPSLEFHPLKGNRDGQYAMTIHGFWRLIITNNGSSIDIAKIEEVSKHYGD